MNLSLGIFFDGTGNNIREAKRQKISNVAKLYNVYGKEGDDSVAKLYIRGVGSTKYPDDDDNFEGATGFSKGISAAIGTGAHDRIAWIISEARKLLRARPEVKSLTVDVFGFSRGAAMARHFVNIIRISKLHKKKQSIRFLGLFDTVGSFGIPGNNKDGMDFQVSTKYVRYIYQLVAENELRKNFDLQSIRKKSSDPLQFNDDCCKGNRWKVEILCPGVHSDIGGSYDKLKPDKSKSKSKWPWKKKKKKKFEQGNDNNLLSRVYLERMYKVARKCDVPFVPPPTADRKEFWEVDKDIKTMLSNILGYYKRQPELRIMHAILREAEARLAVEKYRFDNMDKYYRPGGKRRVRPLYLKRKRNVEILSKGIPALEKLFLAEAFNNDNDRRNTFIRNYRTFSNRYMHNSHFPTNLTPGMDPQTLKMIELALLWPSTSTDPKVRAIKKTLRREVFFNNGA